MTLVYENHSATTRVTRECGRMARLSRRKREERTAIGQRDDDSKSGIVRERSAELAGTADPSLTPRLHTHLCLRLLSFTLNPITRFTNNRVRSYCSCMFSP